MTRTFLRAWLGVLLVVSSAFGAQDVLTRARQAPTPAAGIQILEQHLAQTPDDVDARLLYGLMLSWEGRYDEARKELQTVLAKAPDYTDARVGLMNVEWWSGNTLAAREQSNYILSRDPGHTQARLVRQRLDAADRPWKLGFNASYDRFNDDRRSWNEEAITLSRDTPAGSVIVRASRADRFDLEDQQFEVEYYPIFRRGTYAFLGAGTSPDHRLYPKHRFAFDFYQSVGRGLELSVGYRRLNFAVAADIYIASLSKYAGNWLVTGKISRVPRTASLGVTTTEGSVRRYFGSDGTSFAGVSFSHGLNRQEIRGAGDLLTLASNTVRGQVNADLTPRWRVTLAASTSRQQRATIGPLWQNTLDGGLLVRF